jgi:serine/threonine protein kinase
VSARSESRARDASDRIREPGAPAVRSMRLMPLSAGEAFAGFRIVRLLGSGGMGEVYLAAEYRARFNREADLASTLWPPAHCQHPRPGRIQRPTVCRGERTRLCHKQGLLHRDVKPANIMLTHVGDDEDEQRILLADFGIARDVNDISGLTATNMTVGTVAYSAPDQLMGEEIDGRADQYALAATAYHLLTGSQLFPHSNPAVVIGRHLNSPPPALADTRPELATLDPVLGVALGKDAADRFARCADFARALAEQVALGSASSVAPTKSAPASRRAAPSAAEPAGRSAVVASAPKRWLHLAVAAAVVVLAGVVALAWHPWQSGRSTSTPTSSSQPPAAASAPLPSSPAAPAPPLVPGTADSEPAGTEIITALAVDARGQPTNGY